MRRFESSRPSHAVPTAPPGPAGRARPVADLTHAGPADTRIDSALRDGLDRRRHDADMMAPGVPSDAVVGHRREVTGDVLHSHRGRVGHLAPPRARGGRTGGGRGAACGAALPAEDPTVTPADEVDATASPQAEPRAAVPEPPEPAGSAPQDAPPGFPVVGIGASAGGVEALEGFFRGVPAAPGMAFVVVTHLGRGRTSLLHEIVARHTVLEVQVAADGVPVRPDRVYVMAVAGVLTIQGGVLHLSEPGADKPERKPVDVFFSALALDQGERAAGVVLSGGDGDGTLGVKAIKEHGGLALAQVADRDGPAHSGMPDSAIAAGFVDFAVPAERMGAHLVAFARALRQPGGVAALLEAQGTAAHGLRQEICDILRRQVGHDFAGYKPSTFGRRVERRMQVTQRETIEGYVELLRADPAEVRLLFRDLLINVTDFFRDAEAFAALAGDVIPGLFEGRGAGDTVRVWVPGCATGEEAYSLAMLLREHLDTLDVQPRVQIFATDIDEHALSVARAARYPLALLGSVSAARRQRFLVRDGAAFVLAREVREMCLFSLHSVLRDPPFSRIDLISCRNLLIYFDTDTQNQVLPTFHYALRPAGILFLGLSENTSQFTDLFARVDGRQRIFRARTEGVPTVRLPMLVGTRGLARAERAAPAGALALRQAVEGQVLDRFAPPHVVVTGEGEVVYYSARTGRYLEPAAGAPTRQVLSLVRRELRLDLRAVLQESVASGRPSSCERLALELDGGQVQLLSLVAEPLRDQGQGERLFVVLFREAGPAMAREDAQNRGPVASEAAVAALEGELHDVRGRLQFTVEEYETALEELKVSNEELTSVNEEMQSSNEELEASREELQSLNEELQTVNTELHGKIEALDQAHGDLQNLFESTDIATVFLDAGLAIRSFTPAASRVFNILPGDRGRVITDLASRIPLPGFDADLRAVLDGGTALERRVDLDEGRETFLVRLVPYRDMARRIDGAVVSFLDVTGLTRAEARQRVLIAELQHRTRNLLAVVQAIARQTLGRTAAAAGAPDGTAGVGEAALAAYMERLSALSRVQGLLSRAGNGEEVGLAEIVALELRAHVAPGDPRVAVSGPAVTLSADRVQTFALALHELTTNAVKHGALRGPQGRLDIAWAVEDGTRLVLDWRESGVAMPADRAERRGYGRVLIEQALAFTLQARTRLAFGADGVTCRVEMSLAPGDAAAAEGPPAPPTHVPPARPAA